MKGQITIWIILGLVIITILGFTIYFQDSIKNALIRQELLEVPPQIKPLKESIDSCLSSVTQDGAILLGYDGGYLQFNEDNLANNVNGFSNVLHLSKLSSQSVAYWYYETNNDISRDNIPSIESLEDDLTGYIIANMGKCFDLRFFTDKDYDIQTSDDENVQVDIKDEIIQVIVTKSLEIKVDNLIFILDRHNGNLAIPLGTLYQNALEIMKTENDNFFLEEKTLDILTAYDEVPLVGTTFDCSLPIWSKSKVEQDFKNILANNIAKIKLKGTNYNEEIHEYFQEDVLSDNDDELHVQFTYSPSWPTTIEITPSNNGFLQADPLLNEVNEGLEGFVNTLFCINHYNFVYDIKYPVLITLTKGDYVFQFATQVVIDNNQARENLLAKEEFTILDDKICANTQSNWVINVFSNDKPLQTITNAEVKLKCSSISCNLGKTNLQGQLDKDVPFCVNGFIVAEKPGFKAGKQQVTTNEPGTTNIILDKIVELPVSIKIIDEKSGLRESYDSEKVIFTFKQDDFVSTLVYPEQNTIRLVPGIYEIDSYIIGTSTHGIQLQPRKITRCVEVPARSVFGIFGRTNEQCFDSEIPGTSLDQVIKGGANFAWKISKEDLEKANSITLYTVNLGFPGTLEELSLVYEKKELASLSSSFIYPTLE